MLEWNDCESFQLAFHKDTQVCLNKGVNQILPENKWITYCSSVWILSGTACLLAKISFVNTYLVFIYRHRLTLTWLRSLWKGIQQNTIFWLAHYILTCFKGRLPSSSETRTQGIPSRRDLNRFCFIGLLQKKS